MIGFVFAFVIITSVFLVGMWVWTEHQSDSEAQIATHVKNALIEQNYRVLEDRNSNSLLASPLAGEATPIRVYVRTRPLVQEDLYSIASSQYDVFCIMPTPTMAEILQAKSYGVAIISQKGFALELRSGQLHSRSA